MADNTTLNAGTGGDVIATDDIGGVKFQRVKVTFGPDGSATDVSDADPLPVTGGLTDTELRATALPVSGPLTDEELRASAVPVSVTGSATSAKQDTIIGFIDGIETLLGAQPVAAQLPASLGQKAKAAALPVTLASDEDLLTANSEYETVAASATDQVLGATGAAGDLLSHLVIVPATTSPGAVSIKDGAGTSISIFAGGTLSSLVPFTVALNMKSLSGAWKVTTGANVSAIGVGNFT